MALTPKVKKRNGEIADFHPQKITIAVQKSFAATLGEAHEQEATEITRAVVDAIDLKFGGTAFIYFSPRDGPQIFWMRVAMGMRLAEKTPESAALRYRVL
jgi:hypothetical protein